MKRFDNLYEEVCSFENLHSAYLKARRGKGYRDYVLEFNYRLEENLLELRRNLLEQTYRHGPYREFIVCDAKKRHIKAAPFRDRVVHHALCRIIEPIFDRSFIYDSYACRRNKGTHLALKKLQVFLKKKESFYCLQGDISKYFDSINHDTLFNLIKRKIKDKRVLWLIKEIIDSSYSYKIYQNLFDFRLTGIPIGNLTSQLFANIYLDQLDQFAKRQIKARYYLRYMDDFLILSPSKPFLAQIKIEIESFLWKELKLKLHPKKVNIFPVKTGIDFLGYRNFASYRLLRKSTVKRFVRRTKFYQKLLNDGLMSTQKFNNSLFSWLAYAKFGNSWNLVQKLTLRFL